MLVSLTLMELHDNSIFQIISDDSMPWRQNNQEPRTKNQEPGTKNQKHAAQLRQHSTTFTAKPPREVSLYFECMSLPVARMVSMTLSSDTK